MKFKRLRLYTSSGSDYISHGLSFFMERHRGNGLPIEAFFVEASRVFVDELGIAPLNYIGRKREFINLEEAKIHAWLVADDAEIDFCAKKYLIMADRPKNPWMSLGYGRINRSLRGPDHLYESVSFEVKWEQDCDSWLRMAGKLCQYFRPIFGCLSDSWLYQMHQRERAMFGKDYSSSMIPVEDTLPPLLLTNMIRTDLIPEGVWWINYWSPIYVENIGIERIRKAGFYKVIENEDGSCLLATTKERLDVTSQEHCEILAGIVKRLQLNKKQRIFKLPPHLQPRH